MSSNYPVGYDSNANLGGPFSNVVPPADPALDIDAVHTNNRNDSIFAIEARVGIYGESNNTSLDWATLTVGGTPNQGLRFAGSHADWPGDVAESGIFVDSATGNVSFHKSGDAVGVFYDLTSTGSPYTPPTGSNINKLQVWDGAAWSATNVIDSTTSAEAIKITQAGTGNILDLTDTSGPTSRFVVAKSGETNINAVTANPALFVEQGSSGALLDLTDGAGPTIRFAVSKDGGTSVNASSTGNALYVEQASSGKILAVYDGTGPASRLEVAKAGDTSITANTTNPALYIEQGSTGDLLNLTDGTGPTSRFTVSVGGEADLVASTTNPALSVVQGSTGDIFGFYISEGPTNRLSLSTNGLLSLSTSSNIESEAFLIDQNDSNMPFINFAGTLAEDKSANISSNLGAEGSVVGPLSDMWSGYRMVKMEVNGVSGWVCFFN